MAKQSCRTCKHLAVALTAAGRRMARLGNVYPCIFPTPPLPALPDSITKHYQYRPEHLRQYMEPDDGAACPTWEKLLK